LCLFLLHGAPSARQQPWGHLYVWFSVSVTMRLGPLGCLGSFVFGGIGVRTQGLMLARQVICHLGPSPSFCLSYFSGRVSCFCPRLASDCDHPTCCLPQSRCTPLCVVTSDVLWASWSVFSCGFCGQCFPWACGPALECCEAFICSFFPNVLDFIPNK
jgi:hypothetical protein